MEIIRVTLKSEGVKTWGLNHRICCKIESDIRNMEEDTEANTIQVSHKDEGQGKDCGWCQGRAGLPQKPGTSQNPRDPKKYPTGRNVVHIISGTLAAPSVNVDNTIHIGEGMLEYFKNAWSEGCYNAITKKEENMTERNNISYKVTSTSMWEIFFLLSFHQSHHPCSHTMVCDFVKSQIYSQKIVPGWSFQNADMQT